MRKYLYIFLALFLLSCTEREVSLETLQERNGLKYIVNEDKPFSGHLVEYKNTPPNITEKQKIISIHYKDGKEHGLSTTWNDSGQKEGELHYKDGTLDGLSASWYKSGQKESEIHHKDGKHHGLATIWYENGQKNSESHFKKNTIDGLATHWYKSGQKKSEIYYKDGKQHGLSTIWYENGQKKGEATYKDGEKNGIATVWNKNGQKESTLEKPKAKILSSFEEQIAQLGIEYAHAILQGTSESNELGGINPYKPDELDFLLSLNAIAAGASKQCNDNVSYQLILTSFTNLISRLHEINSKQKSTFIDVFNQSIENEVDKMTDFSNHKELCSKWKKYSLQVMKNTQESLLKLH